MNTFVSFMCQRYGVLRHKRDDYYVSFLSRGPRGSFRLCVKFRWQDWIEPGSA